MNLVPTLFTGWTESGIDIIAAIWGSLHVSDIYVMKTLCTYIIMAILGSLHVSDLMQYLVLYALVLYHSTFHNLRDLVKRLFLHVKYNDYII